MMKRQNHSLKLMNGGLEADKLALKSNAVAVSMPVFDKV